MNLKKSWAEECVDDNILEIVPVDGQRGCPNMVNRLLLLKVVGSSPLRFASPEQDILCSCANNSIAFQICSCVMIKISSEFFILFPNSVRIISTQ